MPAEDTNYQHYLLSENIEEASFSSRNGERYWILRHPLKNLHSSERNRLPILEKNAGREHTITKHPAFNESSSIRCRPAQRSVPGITA